MASIERQDNLLGDWSGAEQEHRRILTGRQQSLKNKRRITRRPGGGDVGSIQQAQRNEGKLVHEDNCGPRAWKTKLPIEGVCANDLHRPVAAVDA